MAPGMGFEEMARQCFHDLKVRARGKLDEKVVPLVDVAFLGPSLLLSHWPTRYPVLEVQVPLFPSICVPGVGPSAPRPPSTCSEVSLSPPSPPEL